MAQHETRFSYDDSTRKRIEATLVGTERISHFVQRAVEERLTRLEARDERSRRAERMKDREYVLWLLREIKGEG